MKKQSDFTTKILVDQSPGDAFKAINHVRGWWSEEIEGRTDQQHAIINYRYEDIHFCRLQVVELVTDKKVVWHVLENHFKFTRDKTEWTDTKIIFEISEAGSQTQVHFTHSGLTPAYECFEICETAWTNYIQNSLKSLIQTGKGMPNANGNPQTANEKKMSEK